MFLSNLLKPFAGNPAPTDDFWYRDPSTGFIYNGGSDIGIRVNADVAMRLNAVYACVRVIAEDIASLPFFVYRRNSRGGKDRAPDNPLYDLLHSQPNPVQTSFEWREMMMGHLELRGNAYSRIYAGSRGAVDVLWPLHPDRIICRWHTKYKNRVQYEYYPLGGQMEIIEPEEMLHFRLMSFDMICGMKPVDQQREAIGLGLAAQTYATKLFSNGALPSGTLETDEHMSDESFERLNKDIAEKRTGLSNAQKPWILEGGMKWHQLGLTNEQAQFLQSRQYTRSEIAGMFRLSAHKINDLTHATFSNIENLNISHVIDAVRPRCVRVEQACDRDLILNKATYFTQFVLDGMMRGDAISRSTALQIQRRNGVINADEWRDIENMNPLPNGAGQRYIIESNMQFLSESGSAGARAKLESLIGNSANRLARKEVAAVMKIAQKNQGSDFAGKLNEFYAGFVSDLMSSLEIPGEVATALAQRAQSQILAAAEDGGIERFMTGSENDRASYLAHIALGE
jgi:HK97 family phage portal protein